MDDQQRGAAVAEETPPRPAFALPAFRVTSIGDLVSLLGIVGACLYFFNRVYSSVFLSSFGLGVGVVPMTAQDAMVDGFEGMTINILYLWAPVTVGFLLHVLVVLVAAGRGARVADARTASPGRWERRRRRFRDDARVQRPLTRLLVATVAPAVILIAVFLIAVPAELSARRDVAALRHHVAGGCTRCATFATGTASIVGRVVASTVDRLFVLTPDGAIVPLTLDDVKSVTVREDARKAAMS